MMISEHKTASQEVREPRFANYRFVFCETSSAFTLTVFNLFVRIIERYSYILLDAVLLSEPKIMSQEVLVLRFANYRSVFCETSSALIVTVFNLFVRIIKRYSYILLDAVLLSEQKILSQEVRVLRFAKYRSVICETSSRTSWLNIFCSDNKTASRSM